MGATPEIRPTVAEKVDREVNDSSQGFAASRSERRCRYLDVLLYDLKILGEFV